MKTRSILLVFMVALATTLSNCKREGCTDIDALNFDEKAKNDDGTCDFEGSVVFWYDQTTSQNLIDYLSASLTFYVDGNVIGSTGTNVYWASAPDCENGSVAKTFQLGNVKTQSFSYKVIDDWGDEIWKGTVEISGNTCKIVQLVF